MSKLALPLQLLLALALVLNGIGGAMAGVLVPVVSTTIEAAGVSLAADTGDCGNHDEAAADADARAPGNGCHSGDGADCGDSPQCLQACMHASLAMPPLFSIGIQALPADAILHPLASGHPAPPLPSPIRPPIA